ncbi:MAG: deoxyuridine 5'-triphosphate nucleotidohydrolase [Candidatus Nezhaarchaeota archaeon]|nr:deoxyuridine 5'-triphosphate nucleotidohydrolase [Candidatus Nezhaarchaeota archaeon]MCX8141467.1 deoxyuridine 5'-triphosphate nucleotidohydrolase [Candidatus Nezhaarchaeota archaeon]MDW8049733.1 deoxyuridine 5'-triphosphate nucleotidohydrolase [Nitrososphaerota archaeon]
MAVIPGHEVMRMGMVMNLVSAEGQVQPAGIDLTVAEVFKLKGLGYLGFSDTSRRVPDVERLNFDDDGRLLLERGVYRVRYNEVVRVPEDCIAIGYPRSSLMRMGATIVSAVWDPGYEGRGEGLLIVENPHGIVLERNARVMQLIFIKLSMRPLKTYSGAYQHEGL